MHHSLHLRVGKHPSRSSVARAGINSLFFIKDSRLNRQFLVDTGEEVSVLPASVEDRRSSPPTKPLAAANGSVIQTFGQRTVKFTLGGVEYEWSFVLAAVEHPLLGQTFCVIMGY